MGSVEAEEAPVPISTSVVEAGKQTIKNTTQNYSIIEQYDLNYVSVRPFLCEICTGVDLAII